MSAHPNQNLALSLYRDLRWAGTGSAEILEAAGERIGWHARMGKVMWSGGTRRWVSLDRVREDLRDSVRYFEKRLPEWEWSLRRQGRDGYVCHVGRIAESGADRIVARTAEGALCLGLLHALGRLPLRGPWLGPTASPPTAIQDPDHAG